jgi:hypothetical protein
MQIGAMPVGDARQLWGDVGGCFTGTQFPHQVTYLDVAVLLVGVHRVRGPIHGGSTGSVLTARLEGACFRVGSAVWQCACGDPLP